MDIQRRALSVAEGNLRQVEGRAKAGAVAPLDVVEAGQEVQRRRKWRFAAQRPSLGQEQYKLSMFLWDNQAPTIPPLETGPDAAPTPAMDMVQAHKLQARRIALVVKSADEAKLNNIDLELAKNNLLPSLDAEAAPARAPEKFVLGLGYRFGLELKMPILQRKSRGEVLEAQAQADRLVLRPAVPGAAGRRRCGPMRSPRSSGPRREVAAATESSSWPKRSARANSSRFSLGAWRALRQSP
ncbi:MAG: hypothetical protein U0231_04350 [Nitrospiraceae bacterium]